jgi:iron complex transport system substrate-binding protein
VRTSCRSLGPFPKLNPEFVVRADPDLIMVGERNVDGMAQRPGWQRHARGARAARVRVPAAESDVPWCAPARAWPRPRA